VVYVTDAGVIVTDPINAQAAAWLRDEIKQLFDKPIRYLIYSHDHRDHIAGGEVFADAGAVVIAHARARETIVGEQRPTAVPEVTFTDGMTIDLGGKRVELRYVGRNHSDNSIVMHFPAERALFAVDFIPVKSVAYRDLPTGFLPDWIDSLDRVQQIDFDVLVPGHGPLGTKADVGLFRDYMNDLYTQVLAAARQGKSLAETQAAVDLSAYKDWAMYGEWTPLNIQGAYDRIQMHRRGN
jgi:glyoxylase-like metal-dependent hydrolase (beta-lactamase superfamily II)